MRLSLGLKEKCQDCTRRWDCKTQAPKPALRTSSLLRRSRLAPLVSRPGLTQAPRPGPAAAEACRRQPGQDERRRGDVTERRGPSPPRQPHSQLQQARLPCTHLPQHRKHFLGLSDSALHQSLSRNLTPLLRASGRRCTSQAPPAAAPAPSPQPTAGGWALSRPGAHAIGVCQCEDCAAATTEAPKGDARPLGRCPRCSSLLGKPSAQEAPRDRRDECQRGPGGEPPGSGPSPSAGAARSPGHR